MKEDDAKETENLQKKNKDRSTNIGFLCIVKRIAEKQQRQLPRANEKLTGKKANTKQNVEKNIVCLLVVRRKG